MDIKNLDRLIREIAAGSQSAGWMAQVMNRDLPGLGDPDDVREAVGFYGQAERVARLAQLLFIREITIRYPEMLAEVLPQMDRLRDLANDSDQARKDELALVGEGPEF
jgi:hypothetical protein